MRAANRLAFPIEIFDDEGPDFWLHFGSAIEPLGLEITEAGAADWNAWLTRVEPIDPAPWMPGRESGYAGDAPERIVARDIAAALRKKIETYVHKPAWDLLIYENSEGGCMSDQQRAIEILGCQHQEDVERARAAFRQLHLLFGDTVYLDLFGRTQIGQRVDSQHADDWSQWLLAQAAHLRDRELDQVDADALASELESLSRRDQRALQSQVRRLLVHLLKWEKQPKRRARSWRRSIDSSREEIEDLLKENPSFENRMGELMRDQYPGASREAASETGVTAEQFPAECPFTVDQLRDAKFLPGEK